MSKRKTGKLTKVEKFYIDNNSDMSVSDIAKDLNRTEKIIENHRPSDDPVKGHVTKANHYPKAKTVDKLMGHKEGRGVTIMTQEASEACDKTREIPPNINVADRHRNSIHVIKEQ